MLGFLYFGISLLLVLTSSYFFTTVLKSKRLVNTVLFWILTVISQVIISVEILSLLKQVNPVGLLIINSLVFIISFIFRKYKNSPQIDFKEVLKVRDKITYSFKKDKLLLILLAFFLFSSLVSLFLALVIPTNSSDSMSYHLARIAFWVQNNTLAHFETNSLRQLVFPINSEILILWSMVFLRRDFLAVLPEYLSYWGCILVLFSFLSYLKISTRRILWSIFILASLPAVIIESASTQTNLIVGFLLFSSLYLFIYGVREQDKKSLIFSAIAFSIALGTKSTAVLFIPVLGIAYSLIAIKERKKHFYKPVITFILASIPAFLLLSSYNYILNYIDFGSAFGSPYFVYKHTSSFGFKPFLASFIKYILAFLDFSGMKFMDNLNQFFHFFKALLLSIFTLKTSDGLVYHDITTLNTHIHESHSRFGLLGFLLILPLVLKYGLTKLNFTGKKMFYLSLTGLITIGFIISISILMGYCYWYNRFLTTAIVLSSPIIALSYKQKPNVFKIIILSIVILNYMYIPVFTTSKPLKGIYKELNTYDFKTFRDEVRFKEDGIYRSRNEFYDLGMYLKNTVPNHSKIALLFSDTDTYYPFFEINPTWKLYPLRYEILANNKNYNDYDFLVMPSPAQFVDILEKGKINYNYAIQGKNVIFDLNIARDSFYYYLDKTGNATIDNKPVIRCNLIDFSSIPGNFKMVKVLPVGETRKFLVYRKLY